MDRIPDIAPILALSPLAVIDKHQWSIIQAAAMTCTKFLFCTLDGFWEGSGNADSEGAQRLNRVVVNKCISSHSILSVVKFHHTANFVVFM